MSTPAVLLKQPRHVQRLLWLLLFGFVWLQFLGTVHRQVHALSKSADAAAHTAASATAIASTGAWQLGHAAPTKLDQDGSTACQLFDLACSGMALVSAWPLLFAPSFWLWSLGLFSLDDPAPECFAFEARGPPVLI